MKEHRGNGLLMATGTVTGAGPVCASLVNKPLLDAHPEVSTSVYERHLHSVPCSPAPETSRADEQNVAGAHNTALFPFEKDRNAVIGEDVDGTRDHHKIRQQWKTEAVCSRGAQAIQPAWRGGPGAPEPGAVGRRGPRWPGAQAPAGAAGRVGLFDIFAQHDACGNNNVSSPAFQKC